METSSICFAPKTGDRAAMTGWMTVAARRKTAPNQKASGAVPRNSDVSCYNGCQRRDVWIRTVDLLATYR